MARSRPSTAAGRRRASSRPSARAHANPAPKPRRASAPRKPTTRRAAAPPRKPPKKRPARAGAPRKATRPRARAARKATRPQSSGITWPQRLVLIASAALVLTGAYFFWLRDSSLVAINDVEVVGVTTDRDAIVAELTRVGESMTTLHTDSEKIEKAAAAFPTIESVKVDPNFPHGLRIEVKERPPVVVANAGGERIGVAADGTLLRGVDVPKKGLPELKLDRLPAGPALTGDDRDQAVIAGAAPPELKPLIEGVSKTDEHGVEIILRGDIPAYFGGAGAAEAKWAAAAAVLADPNLDYARCVDVRVAARPAVCQDGPVNMPSGTDTTDPQA